MSSYHHHQQQQRQRQQQQQQPQVRSQVTNQPQPQAGFLSSSFPLSSLPDPVTPYQSQPVPVPQSQPQPRPLQPSSSSSSNPLSIIPHPQQRNFNPSYPTILPQNRNHDENCHLNPYQTFSSSSSSSLSNLNSIPTMTTTTTKMNWLASSASSYSYQQQQRQQQQKQNRSNQQQLGQGERQGKINLNLKGDDEILQAQGAEGDDAEGGGIDDSLNNEVSNRNGKGINKWDLKGKGKGKECMVEGWNGDDDDDDIDMRNLDDDDEDGDEDGDDEGKKTTAEEEEGRFQSQSSQPKETPSSSSSSSSSSINPKGPDDEAVSVKVGKKKKTRRKPKRRGNRKRRTDRLWEERRKKDLEDGGVVMKGEATGGGRMVGSDDLGLGMKSKREKEKDENENEEMRVEEEGREDNRMDQARRWDDDDDDEVEKEKHEADEKETRRVNGGSHQARSSSSPLPKSFSSVEDLNPDLPCESDMELDSGSEDQNRGTLIEEGESPIRSQQPPSSPPQLQTQSSALETIKTNIGEFVDFQELKNRGRMMEQFGWVGKELGIKTSEAGEEPSANSQSTSSGLTDWQRKRLRHLAELEPYRLAVESRLLEARNSGKYAIPRNMQFALRKLEGFVQNRTSQQSLPNDGHSGGGNRFIPTQSDIDDLFKGSVNGEVDKMALKRMMELEERVAGEQASKEFGMVIEAKRKLRVMMKMKESDRAQGQLKGKGKVEDEAESVRKPANAPPSVVELPYSQSDALSFSSLSFLALDSNSSSSASNQDPPSFRNWTTAPSSNPTEPAPGWTLIGTKFKWLPVWPPMYYGLEWGSGFVGEESHGLVTESRSASDYSKEMENPTLERETVDSKGRTEEVFGEVRSTREVEDQRTGGGNGLPDVELQSSTSTLNKNKVAFLTPPAGTSTLRTPPVSNAYTSVSTYPPSSSSFSSRSASPNSPAMAKVMKWPAASPPQHNRIPRGVPSYSQTGMSTQNASPIVKEPNYRAKNPQSSDDEEQRYDYNERIDSRKMVPGISDLLKELKEPKSTLRNLYSKDSAAEDDYSSPFVSSAQVTAYTVQSISYHEKADSKPEENAAPLLKAAPAQSPISKTTSVPAPQTSPPDTATVPEPLMEKGIPPSTSLESLSEGPTQSERDIPPLQNGSLSINLGRDLSLSTQSPSTTNGTLPTHPSATLITEEPDSLADFFDGDESGRPNGMSMNELPKSSTSGSTSTLEHHPCETGSQSPSASVQNGKGTESAKPKKSWMKVVTRTVSDNVGGEKRRLHQKEPRTVSTPVLEGQGHTPNEATSVPRSTDPSPSTNLPTPTSATWFKTPYHPTPTQPEPPSSTAGLPMPTIIPSVALNPTSIPTPAKPPAVPDSNRISKMFLPNNKAKKRVSDVSSSSSAPGPAVANSRSPSASQQDSHLEPAWASANRTIPQKGNTFPELKPTKQMLSPRDLTHLQSSPPPFSTPATTSSLHLASASVSPIAKRSAPLPTPSILRGQRSLSSTRAQESEANRAHEGDQTIPSLPSLANRVGPRQNSAGGTLGSKARNESSQNPATTAGLETKIPSPPRVSRSESPRHASFQGRSDSPASKNLIARPRASKQLPVLNRVQNNNTADTFVGSLLQQPGNPVLQSERRSPSFTNAVTSPEPDVSLSRGASVFSQPPGLHEAGRIVVDTPETSVSPRDVLPSINGSEERASSQPLEEENADKAREESEDASPVSREPRGPQSTESSFSNRSSSSPATAHRTSASDSSESEGSEEEYESPKKRRKITNLRPGLSQRRSTSRQNVSSSRGKSIGTGFQSFSSLNSLKKPQSFAPLTRQSKRKLSATQERDVDDGRREEMSSRVRRYGADTLPHVPFFSHFVLAHLDPYISSDNVTTPVFRVLEWAFSLIGIWPSNVLEYFQDSRSGVKRGKGPEFLAADGDKAYARQKCRSRLKSSFVVLLDEAFYSDGDLEDLFIQLKRLILETDNEFTPAARYTAFDVIASFHGGLKNIRASGGDRKGKRREGETCNWIEWVESLERDVPDPPERSRTIISGPNQIVTPKREKKATPTSREKGATIQSKPVPESTRPPPVSFDGPTGPSPSESEVEEPPRKKNKPNQKQTRLKNQKHLAGMGYAEKREEHSLPGGKGTWHWSMLSPLRYPDAWSIPSALKAANLYDMYNQEVPAAKSKVGDQVKGSAQIYLPDRTSLPNLSAAKDLPFKGPLQVPFTKGTRLDAGEVQSARLAAMSMLYSSPDEFAKGNAPSFVPSQLNYLVKAEPGLFKLVSALGSVKLMRKQMEGMVNSFELGIKKSRGGNKLSLSRNQDEGALSEHNLDAAETLAKSIRSGALSLEPKRMDSDQAPPNLYPPILSSLHVDGGKTSIVSNPGHFREAKLPFGSRGTPKGRGFHPSDTQGIRQPRAMPGVGDTSTGEGVVVSQDANSSVSASLTTPTKAGPVSSKSSPYNEEEMLSSPTRRLGPEAPSLSDNRSMSKTQTPWLMNSISPEVPDSSWPSPAPTSAKPTDWYTIRVGIASTQPLPSSSPFCAPRINEDLELLRKVLPSHSKTFRLPLANEDLQILLQSVILPEKLPALPSNRPVTPNDEKLAKAFLNQGTPIPSITSALRSIYQNARISDGQTYSLARSKAADQKVLFRFVRELSKIHWTIVQMGNLSDDVKKVLDRMSSGWRSLDGSKPDIPDLPVNQVRGLWERMRRRRERQLRHDSLG